MSISDEDVARVRAATDIVALIGEHAALKRQGRRWVGLCPFHDEKTPSFSVNAEEGLYYCFGCQASGDVITFVRQVESLDFVEAVRRLAERAGISIREDPATQAEWTRKGPLYEAMAKAVELYHERLLSAPDAGPARDYLRSRGYDGEVVRLFKLGWAPEGWDWLARYLDVGDKVLQEAGLGFVNRRGRQQDAFRGRVIFPIFDPSGRAVALGGRILPHSTTGGPKYKNSPEGPLYSKRRVLYGLNWAKQDVIASGDVIVCEGYTDVIAFFRAGMPRAVATCGTALGEEHFRLLRNFAKRVVLAYDADAAGQAGAGRVYEWESRHEVDVAVAALPPGSDPADLAIRDVQALRDAVEGAKPFLAFRVQRILDAGDLDTAEGRARAAEAAVAAVSEHPDSLVRDQYLMMVADRCRLDAAALREWSRNPTLAGSRERSARSEPRSGAVHPGSGRTSPNRPEGAAEHRGDRDRGHAGRDRQEASARAELEALRYAIHQPELVANGLETVLFGVELFRDAFDILAASDGLHQAISHAQGRDPRVADLLRRLAVEEPVDPPEDVIVQLTRMATRRVLAAMEVRGRLQPEEATDLALEVRSVRADLDALDDQPGAAAAAARLLAWLIGWGEEEE